MLNRLNTKEREHLAHEERGCDLMSEKKCTIDGCNGKLNARGLCHRHYVQQRRAGKLQRKEHEDDRSYIINRIRADESGCWVWSQSTRKGYGRLIRKGRTWNAHVFSFSIFVRPVEDGEQINHKCHVRACCNPDHLYAGSQSENMADMKLAGRVRYLKGDQNGNSRIDKEKARAIYAANGIARDVAERFGVSISLVYAIRKKKVWAHIHE